MNKARKIAIDDEEKDMESFNNLTKKKKKKKKTMYQKNEKLGCNNCLNKCKNNRYKTPCLRLERKDLQQSYHDPVY